MSNVFIFDIKDAWNNVTDVLCFPFGFKQINRFVLNITRKFFSG